MGSRGSDAWRTRVVLVDWPEEEDRLVALRASGTPRLLVVRAGDPPVVTDPLEDWVRAGAPEVDVAARMATLAGRARVPGDPPWLDDDGLLHRGEAWVALSPVEAALAGALLERFGTVVSRETLTRRAWPTSSPSRNALDVHVLRLRRRIAPLRLELRTVRARGYLLQAAGEPPGFPDPTPARPNDRDPPGDAGARPRARRRA